MGTLHRLQMLQERMLQERMLQERMLQEKMQNVTLPSTHQFVSVA